MLVPILIAILIGYLFFELYTKRQKLPPGPIPLPIIGNLHQFYLYKIRFGDIVKALDAFKKEYGPVFTLWLGSQPTVHIGSMDLAQETMVKQGSEYVDRWMPLIFNMDHTPYGITGNSGEIWQSQRRFSLHVLRNFGFGKSIMEDRIMAEFNFRTAKLDESLKNGTGVVQAYQFINLLVGSIINRILFSVRFEEKDEETFFKNKGIIDRFGDFFTPTDYIMTRHWMLAVPFFRKRWGFLGDAPLTLKNFFKRQVEVRMDAIASGDHVIDEEPNDYVDAYFQKLSEDKGRNKTSFNVESLIQNIADIWIAGQVTTSSTLTFGIAHLLHNPKILQRVLDELRNVAQGRPLTLTDKPQTPYFVATLHEIQRMSSLLNINFFRTHRGDTTVDGTPVAGGTPITAELSLIMRDEKYFKDPDTFIPDRFIENPKLDQQMVPFGMGKRVCLGESLARAELYLLLGNLLVSYDIKPSEKMPQREKSNDYAVFSTPVEFDFYVTKVI